MLSPVEQTLPSCIVHDAVLPSTICRHVDKNHDTLGDNNGPSVVDTEGYQMVAGASKYLYLGMHVQVYEYTAR